MNKKNPHRVAVGEDGCKTIFSVQNDGITLSFYHIMPKKARRVTKNAELYKKK